jgi:hypothetical protein
LRVVVSHIQYKSPKFLSSTVITVIPTITEKTKTQRRALQDFAEFGNEIERMHTNPT